MKSVKNTKAKINLKRGDNIIVISGDSKGKTGTISSVDLTDMKAIIGGLNMVSRHIKPSTNQPNGSIVKKEAPIHLSNLQIVDSKGKPSKIGKKLNKEGKFIRIAKTTGEEIKNG